jgi:K+-sensing histidine kinase KdpD
MRGQVEQTLRKRLVLGHVSIVLVVVLSTATALVALRSAVRQTERTSEIGRRIAGIEHLRTDARELARSARRLLLTGDLKEAQRVLAIEAEMNQERTRAETREQGLDDLIDDYVEAVVSSASMVRTDPGVALARFEDDLIRVRRPLTLAFDAMVSRERAMIDASNSSQRLARWAQLALVVAATLAVLLTIGSALAMSLLLRRDKERTRGAEAVADRATTQHRNLLAASDELRGPLAKIVTQAAELRAKDRPEEETQILQSIASSASRVDNLLRQLLDVTAVQAGTVALRQEPCDVATLVDRAIQDHREAAHERGLRLRFETRLSLTVSADPERIAYALSSLLGLAIKSARIGAEILMSAVPTDNAVRFAIVDSGASVPIPASFPPAVTAPPIDVVLQLCQRVIEAHGGRFGIEAAAAGRTYWFTLPTEPRLLT